MISIRIWGFCLTLVALSMSANVFAEYPQGYGAYGQQGYGAAPFMGQQQYPMGQGAGGGGGSGAKYEKSSDVNELKKSGPEYAKQISENASESIKSSAEATKEVVNSIGELAPDETPVSEAVTKAAEGVASALSSKGTNQIVDRIEKDTLALANTLAQTEVKKGEAAVVAIKKAAEGKEPIRESTMTDLLASIQQDNTIGGTSRQGGGSALGQMIQGEVQGAASQLASVPSRDPASHAMMQKKTLLPETGGSAPQSAHQDGNAVTSFERGLIHNPPTGLQ